MKKNQTGTLIKTRVTYLEMKSRPDISLNEPQGSFIVLAKPMSFRFYRYLFHAVGDDVGWADRKALNDEELSAVITHDYVDIFALSVHGVPAGFAELDRREEPDIEIKYFGLMPEYRGKGLGGYFLKWIIRQAWSFNPRRLWLHTNDRDHPGALGNYVKNGFSIYDEKTENQLVLDVPVKDA